MSKLSRKFFFLAMLSGMFFYSFFPALAQENGNKFQEETFKARVEQVLEEREVAAPAGGTVIQQNLRLEGLEGEWKDKEIVVKNIDDLLVVRQARYTEGDVVLVSRQALGDEEVFYIADAVRTTPLLILFLLFIAVVVAIGRKKGIKALVILGVTFFIILKIMIPLLLRGDDPLVVSVVGSFFILLLAVMGTEGWNRQSKIAMVSILFSLAAIVLLSSVFTSFARLTGLWSEEAMYIALFGGPPINMQGLLLAGLIIGALGVIDDVVISQVSLVAQLLEANPNMESKELFSKAMHVGTDHIAAIVNTLFLAYAGASLPLLILFTFKEPPFATWTQIVNNELIATEIVRTLVGSLGLVLALPFATWLAVRVYKKYGVGKGGGAHLHSREKF